MSENNLIVREEKNNNLFNKALKNFQGVIFLSNKSFRSLSIRLKRRNIMHDFEKHYNLGNYSNAIKKEKIEKRYNESYDAYLKALDSYIKENIYPKVMENKGSYDENVLVQDYLNLLELKEIDYMEYKYKRQ